MTQRGRPPKKPEDRRSYQRVAMLTSTYKKATYNAAKRDLSLIDYFDKVIKKEK